MKVPFKNLQPESWQRLAAASVILLYLVLVGVEVKNRTLFDPAGYDYLSFWSAARVESQAGYAAMYDINALAAVQSQQLTQMGFDFSQTTPYPFPPVFILPFQLFAQWELIPSFWIWTGINLVILAAYLIFFVRKISPGRENIKQGVYLILLTMISYPVYQNFFWGQVEVLLLICAGEFIRNDLKEKPFLSGLWLGGLLIKPQVLILVVPALFLMKKWRHFFGFLLSALVVFISSILLSGTTGLIAMVKLWTNYASGIATNAPEQMTNWRMIAVNFNQYTSSNFGWVLAGTGMILTLVLCSRFLRVENTEKKYWLTGMLGIFAATLVFTWHSHVHMAMVIVPFIIYACLHQIISAKMFTVWVVIPFALKVVLSAVDIMLVLNNLPLELNSGRFLLNLSFMVMELYLLFHLFRYRIPIENPKVIKQSRNYEQTSVN